MVGRLQHAFERRCNCGNATGQSWGALVEGHSADDPDDLGGGTFSDQVVVVVMNPARVMRDGETELDSRRAKQVSIFVRG